ncbi:MAG: orotate phosphoribosyltransferase [Actinobacteria bacterium]|nr:orotate phosphoribosyltransferase [Actinomycetota bacterium]MCI0678653.1 orotate phosphoribosyltransferase [Actinomycetota bacterium]
MSRTSLIDHLASHALRTDGPFTLRSGVVSDWYLDARQTTFDGEGAWVVGEAVLEVLDTSVEAVGGLTMGADPIAVATAMVAWSRGRPLRSFSIRKAEKSHGMGGRVVGPVGAGDRVAILEDTTTTGEAAHEAAVQAREAGMVLVQVIALVDRSDGAARRRLEELGVPYAALVSPADLGVGG